MGKVTVIHLAISVRVQEEGCFLQICASELPRPNSFAVPQAPLCSEPQHSTPRNGAFTTAATAVSTSRREVSSPSANHRAGGPAAFETLRLGFWGVVCRNVEHAESPEDERRTGPPGSGWRSVEQGVVGRLEPRSRNLSKSHTFVERATDGGTNCRGRAGTGGYSFRRTEKETYGYCKSTRSERKPRLSSDRRTIPLLACTLAYVDICHPSKPYR
jgi:hypothetical protein